MTALIARCLLTLGLVCIASQAQAQFATGGSGLYRNDIIWFNWAGHDAAIPSGTSRTVTNNLAGQTFSATCTLSNIVSETGTGGIVGYRPGAFSGDGLDDLYNIGGTGTANQLVTGISYLNVARKRFDITCSATRNGAPANLNGLVFAEAETSINNELVEVTTAGTPRLIDRFRTCTTASSIATRSGNTTSMSGQNTTFCASGGPMAVLFLDGAAGTITGTARVGAITAGGRSAISLGVLVDGFDLSDAPASYGNVSHLQSTSFSGGAVTNGMNVSTATLATKVTPVVRLGTSVDADVTTLSSTTANGDDADQGDDEDAFPATGVGATPLLQPGGAYSLNVPCAGTASVAGWVDFNTDGDFADSGERSNTAACTAGSAALAWTVPANLRGLNSFARFRIATNAAEIATATSTASSGEVEDHTITLTTNDFADAPASYGSASHLVVPGFQLGATNTADAGDYNSANASADADDGVAMPATLTAGAAVNIPVTRTGTVSGAPGLLQAWFDWNRDGDFADAGEQVATNVAATGTVNLAVTPPGNAVAGVSFARFRWSTQSSLGSTGTAPNGEVEDNAFTMTGTADFIVTKTNTPANGPSDQANDVVVAGQQTTYTITVTNNGPSTVTGAIVTDDPDDGLNCPPANAVTITGSGIPAGSFTVAHLTGAGIPLATLTAGQATLLTFTCTVL